MKKIYGVVTLAMLMGATLLLERRSSEQVPPANLSVISAVHTSTDMVFLPLGMEQNCR